MAGLLAVCAGFSACDDNFERPPFEDFIPQATLEANTTSQELKEMFNQDVNYFATEIGTREDGSHYIVKGRIVSSDEAGNFFKKIAIEDEDGGLIFSIDATKLYETYKYGQEVVVDVTGMYYGNYGMGVQIGSAPSGTSDAPSRMPSDMWTSAAQTSGLVDLTKLDIYEITVEEAQAIRQDPAQLLRWQGRLVRIKDVHFQDPGKELGVSGQSNNTTYILDDAGRKMAINTSGYSTFYTTPCPKGTGNVLAVLTNYNSDWQLLLNNVEGLEGFTPWTDEPVDPADAVGSFTIDFENGSLPADWIHKAVLGNKDWYVTSFSGNYYAAMTGYKGTAPFESWLISQPVDAAKMAEGTLTFDTQVNGYGSTTTTFKVYILDNPDPTKANKTELHPVLAQAPASGYSSWVSSTPLSLASASGVFYIGWVYEATADANFATWCVDNIVVK